jgi:hypothetical protein
LSLFHTTSLKLTVSSSSTQTSSSVTVRSADSSNNAISGYYTILYQNGAVVKTGFTPAIFSTTSGQTYSVEVQDYAGYYFNHWSDNGSTNRQRTFTATSTSQTLTAVYSTSPQSSSGGTSGSGGGGSTTGTIAVKTTDSSGSQIYGFYTTLWENGVKIKSAFSPASFTVTNGQMYQVAVADYGSYVFDHWSDGSNNRFHNAQAGNSLTAVYRVQ